MVKIIYISKIIFGKTHLFSVWRSSIQILLWETKPVLLNVIWFIVLNVIGFIVIWFINHPFSTYRRLLGRCHPFFKWKSPFWRGKQIKWTELFWFWHIIANNFHFSRNISLFSLSCNFQGSTTPTELFPMGVCLSINWDCFSHDKYTPGTLSYNSIWIRTVWSCSDSGNYKHEREKSLLTCEEMLGHQGRLNVKWFNRI